MFFERYLYLCNSKRLTPSAAAVRAGFNKGTVSVWKKKFENGVDVRPEPEVIAKICAYFNCTEPWLLGIDEQKKETPTPKSERDIQNEELIKKLESDEVLRAAVLRFAGIE